MKRQNRISLITVDRLYLFIVGISSLLLVGCGSMMKGLSEDLSDEYIDFNPIYTAEFASRSGSAASTAKSKDELERDDFIDLGSLSVKYVNKRCFPGEECEIETHSGLPTNRLLKEAADVGADAVKLTQDNISGSGQAVKNGDCIRTEVRQVPREVCNYDTVCDGSGYCYSRKGWCRTEYSSQTVCVEWEKIYGTEYYDRSFASVWRNDPQLIVEVKFGDLFYESLKQGEMREARQYLDQGIRADIQDLRGRYPIMTAVGASKNKVAVTRLVLEHDANPKIENNKPLEMATRTNNTELVSLLLEFGANPNDSVGIWGALTGNEIIDKGLPIINASKKNNTAMVGVLLENRADPDVDNGAPLRQAISHDNMEMLLLLLDKGASVREDGVLTTAVEKNDIELVKLIMDHGADPDNRSWSGKTPLQIASQTGQIDVMQLLLDKGASVNKRGVGGAKTPLMFATEAGQVEAVRLLIDNKAGVNIDDVPTGVGWLVSLVGVKANTPLSIAKSRHGSTSDATRKADYQKIIDMLVAAGGE